MAARQLRQQRATEAAREEADALGARCRERARAQLAAAAADDPELGRAMEKAAFNALVTRCRKRRAVVGLRYVPATWEDACFRRCYACEARKAVNALRLPGAVPGLRAGTLTPSGLLAAKPWEMDEARWAREVTVQEQAKEQEHDGLFRCRCKSRKTTITQQIQKRSADEPMSTYVLCTTCGHRFVVN